jgi:hypothetical protein
LILAAKYFPMNLAPSGLFSTQTQSKFSLQSSTHQFLTEHTIY